MRIMSKESFIEEYSLDGSRDRYYLRKFGYRLQLPVNKGTPKWEDGKLTYPFSTELGVSTTKKDSVGRVYVYLDDTYGLDLEEIPDVLTRFRMEAVKLEADRAAVAAKAAGVSA